jgi:hypothetical protein
MGHMSRETTGRVIERPLVLHAPSTDGERQEDDSYDNSDWGCDHFWCVSASEVYITAGPSLNEMQSRP